MRALVFLLKLLLKIVMVPVILALTLFVWICVGIVYVSGLVLGLISMVIALLEEQARDLGFHFIFIEHDLEDSRTVSRQDMRKCVNNYMSVVVGEEPLDPTLVDFDDSEAW